MTPADHKRIDRLMKLADIALDEEFVDADLVGHFHNLREDYGLAKLLTLIQEYVGNQTQSRSYSQTPEITTENASAVQ